MEYFNKIMSAVSTVKGAVDSALPGNPVTREYEAVAHVASAGPGLSWKIYSGYKKSSRKEVSIWLFEKKALDNWTMKKDRDSLFEALKAGVYQLTRLRHPRCLHVEHPLEESRETLAFCTEPVFASLANVLGRVDNMPPALPGHIAEFNLEKIEIQHGLQELTEALQFLHVDAKILHRNICPESILITKSDCWKLAGFDFCVVSHSTAEQVASYPLVEWDSALTPFAQPPLNYLAPEYVTSGRCDGFADIFSFGVLTYAIFNKGRPLFDHNHSVETLKTNSAKLKSLPLSLFSNVPQEIKDDLKLCLQLTPELRPDASQLCKVAFFDDANVKQLQQLESLCQLDGPQKAQFFKNLTANLNNYSTKLLTLKILTFVAEELKSLDLAPFALPIVLFIAEKVDAQEFSTLILPALAPLFAVQSPCQIPILLLQKMDMFLSKTPPDEIRRTILPLIFTSLDSNLSQLQEPCLSILPNVVHLMDSKSIKNLLLPKLLQLASEVTVISVKVNALISLGKMIDKLERWMVVDQILPTLSKISSKEPAVLMAVLGIFKLSFSNAKINLSKEVCAKHCIPFLAAASVENSLNLKQFESFIGLIKEMIGKVEHEQRSRLQHGMSPSPPPMEPYNSNSIISPTAEKPSNLAPKVTPPKPAGPKVLSLEEKKRLAAEQEQTTRLRNQAPLQPASSSSITVEPKNVQFNSPPPFTQNPIRPPTLNSNLTFNPAPTLMPLSAPPPSSNPVLSRPIGGTSQPVQASQMPTYRPNTSMTSNNADWSVLLNSSSNTSSTQFGTASPQFGTTTSQFGTANSQFGASSTKKPANSKAFDDLVIFPGGNVNSSSNASHAKSQSSAKNELNDLFG